MTKYPYFDNKFNHSTQLRLNVGILLLINSSILLELRSDNRQWGLVGGRVEIGESPTVAACRETFEETNITLNITQLKLFGIYGDVSDNRIVYYNDANFHIIDIIYIYQLDSILDIRKSKESLELHAFHYNSIPFSNLIRPAHRPLGDFLRINKL